MRVVIDGNIGSGKSTQLNLLKDLGFRVRKEPINEWPLELYYSDPVRWGFLMQLSVLSSFADPEDDVIFERSMQSSRLVFWDVMNKTPEEDRVYTSLYEKLKWTPDLVIYLRSDPEKCFERIEKRGQSGDNGISLNYLRALHTKYEQNDENVYTIDVEGLNEKEICAKILHLLIVKNAMQFVHQDGTQVSSVRQD